MTRTKRVPREVAPLVESHGDSWSLRFGRWQDRLATDCVDAVVTDAPYGGRVHASAPTRNDGVETDGLAPQYAPWTGDDVVEFVKSWSPRTDGWIVNMTSDDLITPHRDAFEDAKRVHFVMPAVIDGMTCRMQGDGPSSEAIYLVLARPRSKAMAAWGTTRGYYKGPRSSDASGGRGKPQWLLNALVRDYTRAGSLVADPFAGWGSTLKAAVGNGRRAIGSEMDREAYDKAVAAMSAGVQRDLFASMGVG